MGKNKTWIILRLPTDSAAIHVNLPLVSRQSNDKLGYKDAQSPVALFIPRQSLVIFTYYHFFADFNIYFNP